MTDNLEALKKARKEALTSIKKARGKVYNFSLSEHREREQLERDRMFAEIEARESIGIQEMRKKWSDVILTCVGAIVIFDIILVTSIGLGWLKFSDSFIIPAILGDSLIKVLGLAAIIAHFLFSYRKK